RWRAPPRRRCTPQSGGRRRPPGLPPLLTGRESRPSPAAEPASCHLPDHGNGPAGQGGLEPASSSGGLVVAKGPWDQIKKGHGGSLRLPRSVPERLDRHSRLSVIAG